jgi:hypothetical protein
MIMSGDLSAPIGVQNPLGQFWGRQLIGARMRLQGARNWRIARQAILLLRSMGHAQLDDISLVGSRPSLRLGGIGMLTNCRPWGFPLSDNGTRPPNARHCVVRGKNRIAIARQLQRDRFNSERRDDINHHLKESQARFVAQ